VCLSVYALRLFHRSFSTDCYFDVGPCQHGDSWFRVSRNSRPYFTVSLNALTAQLYTERFTSEMITTERQVGNVRIVQLFWHVRLFWFYHLQNCKTLRKYIVNIKSAFHFSLQFLSGCSFLPLNIQRIALEMRLPKRARLWCPELTRIGMGSSFLVETCCIKCHGNPLSGSRVVSCRWTNKHGKAKRCILQPSDADA
jgi:hypothetical protein